MTRLLIFPILILLAAPGAVAAQAPGSADECEPPPSDGPATALARTDHQVSGNRVAHGCGPLSGNTVDVDLGGNPRWVLPDPSDRGSSWFVVLDDGSVDHVIAGEGEAPFVSQTETPPLAPGEPPLALALGDEQLIVGSAHGAAGWFDDALPGTRVTEAPGGRLLALTDPTDRYGHGVLGDDLEAAAITVRDTSGGATAIEIVEPDVIEGLAAMLVDIVGEDGDPEILVTLSNKSVGARLVAYGLGGEVVAESEPIGQGNRWMHLIGGGPTGPGGQTELIAVRTPHIGGVVEAYQLIDDRLELVASRVGYSSHQLGSSNLDMALLADADGDGRLDVVVPNQEMTELAALARTADAFRELWVVPLDGTLATNVAATADADGALVLAVGTSDGRLRIFR